MFISFEGSEGSGKTTQINLLADYLRQNGREVELTRQPGGTYIGEQVRKILHSVTNTAMSAEAEILLYSADRAQHVTEMIRPALANGKIVLCDRYADSTIAYQGYGRGIDMDHLQSITAFATGGLKPDLTILLDVDVSEGLRRRLAGREEMNRMDLQEMSFYERVQLGYHQLVEQEPERWVVVKAGRSIAAIQEDVQKHVAQHL